MVRHYLLFFLLLSGLLLFKSAGVTGPSAALASAADEENKRLIQAPAIGKSIFFDKNLSEPVGVSCATCHNPQRAFADSRAVSPGAVQANLGQRNAPSLMYAALIRPIL